MIYAIVAEAIEDRLPIVGAMKLCSEIIQPNL